MNIKLRFLGLATALSPLVWFIQTTACTGDDSASGGAGAAGTGATTGTTGGTGAAGTPAATGGTSSGGASGAGSTAAGAGGSAGASATGSACANPVAIAATKPAWADFENYTGTSLATWNFALGGDMTTGVLTGTFGYGDQPSGMPPTFEMSAGHDSMYAMRIADPMAMVYGGGMGLWISACLNGSAFTGITFWVKGNSPSPTATFSLGMGDTLSSTPSKPGAPYGTCPGDSTTCVNPTFAFPVTADWVQIKAPWSGFKAGSAAGTTVTPDGKDITQLQWGVALNFVPTVDGGTDYEPVPAPYELVVDDVAFY